MTAAQLMYIKRVQRDFENIFHTRLIVDFPAMNGEGVLVDPELQLEKTLEDYCKEYGVTIQDIRSKRIGSRTYYNTAKGRNIRRVLGDFSRFVKKNKCSEADAAKLINRDRTMISTYSKEKI